MATIHHYGLLAEKVYDRTEGTMVPGWKCVMLATHENGFQGGVYTRKGDCVVAYKGTKPPNVGDLTADYQLAIGGLPGQLEPAVKLLDLAKRRAGTNPISLCGHSLGGGLAQVVGYQFGLNFVTFNAPPMATNVDSSWAKKARTWGSGVLAGLNPVAALIWYGVFSRFAQKAARGKELGRDLGLNFRLAPDIVSAAWWGGDHVGRVINLPYNGPDPHGMKTMRTIIDGGTFGPLEPFKQK